MRRVLSVNTFPRKGPSRPLKWNYYVTSDSLLVMWMWHLFVGGTGGGRKAKKTNQKTKKETNEKQTNKRTKKLWETKQRNNSESRRPFRFASEHAWSWTKLQRMWLNWQRFAWLFKCITFGKFVLNGLHYFYVILDGSHVEMFEFNGSQRFTCPIKEKEQYILSTLCEPLWTDVKSCKAA